MTDSTLKVEEGKLYRLTKTITAYGFPTGKIIPVNSIVMVLHAPRPSLRVIQFLLGEQKYTFDLFDLDILSPNEILEEVNPVQEIELSFPK